MVENLEFNHNEQHESEVRFEEGHNLASIFAKLSQAKEEGAVLAGEPIAQNVERLAEQVFQFAELFDYWVQRARLIGAPIPARQTIVNHHFAQSVTDAGNLRNALVGTLYNVAEEYGVVIDDESTALYRKLTGNEINIDLSSDKVMAEKQGIEELEYIGAQHLVDMRSPEGCEEVQAELRNAESVLRALDVLQHLAGRANVNIQDSEGRNTLKSRLSDLNALLQEVRTLSSGRAS